MENHLIGQFQGKQILQAIIEALGEELDELELFSQGCINLTMLQKVFHL